MFKDKPKYCVNSKGLIFYLSKYVSTSEFSEDFDISTSYVRNCKNLDKEVFFNSLFKKYPSEIRRSKINIEEEKQLKLFLNDYCPVKSGSKDKR